MSELHKLLDNVADEGAFLAFVKALERDRRDAVKREADHPSLPYGPDARAWESTTIEDFLESACAWAEDSDFGRRIADPAYALTDVSARKRFATFSYCGKVYE